MRQARGPFQPRPGAVRRRGRPWATPETPEHNLNAETNAKYSVPAHFTSSARARADVCCGEPEGGC
eukprot:3566209-Prymnesium_polylepis.1